MDWQWERKTETERQPEGWIWEPEAIDTTGRPYGKSRRIGQILREEVYDCGFCRGTGQRPKGSKCPVCKGNETVTVKPPAVVCAFCKGRGEEKPRTTITCSVCRGKGIVSVQEPIQKCPTCQGRGRAIGSALYCMTCKGKGVVTTKGEAAEDTRGAATARHPGGSEREVLEILLELGKVGRHGIGGRMHISASYANYLCQSLLGKGLITKVDRDHYALTPMGESIFEKESEKEEEETKVEEKVADNQIQQNQEDESEGFGMWRVEK